MLKKHVHEDFYMIDLIKKGIVYIHGKMPEQIKDYLEYKFNQNKQLKVHNCKSCNIGRYESTYRQFVYTYSEFTIKGTISKFDWEGKSS